jgi:hypothetical protein
MATVNFTVTIMGGTGIGVFIKVDKNLMHFDTSGNKTLELDPDDYIAQVAGSEPSDGTVQITIAQNGKVLREAKFTQPSFWALMPFTVK